MTQPQQQGSGASPFVEQVLVAIEIAYDRMARLVASRYAAARARRQAQSVVLGQLLREISDALQAVAEGLAATTREQQTAAVTAAAGIATSSALEALGTTDAQVVSRFRDEWTSIPVRILNQLTHPDSIVQKLYESLGTDAVQELRTILGDGLKNGSAVDEIARDIEKTLYLSRVRSMTIARTEVIRSFRRASLEQYRENSDIVVGWVWFAQLQLGPCAGCLSQHGTVHPLTEPMDSHPNCRCAMIPKTAPWASIDPNLAFLDDTSQQIPTGDEWLRRQTVAVQKKTLGGYYKLWQAGKPLSAFVDKRETAWGLSYLPKALSRVR